MCKRLFVLVMMILAPGLFGGCGRTETGGMVTNEPVNEQAGRISQDTMTESDLENTIRARLNNDSQLRDASLDVDADVGRNEVTLSGMVETNAMRYRAIELAAASHPGIVVNNRMEVRQRELLRSEYTEENAREERARAKERGETIGDSLDDAWIHTRIVASLTGYPDTPKRGINVDVKNNAVTLRGVVDTAEQKTEAERLAKETEGVKRVVNQLKVEKTSGKGPETGYT